MRRIGSLLLGLVLGSGVLALLSPPAWAVPAFSRRYGVSCSTCHDAWPHLNPTGVYFRLSGYRRLNGRDLQPTTKDIDVAMGALSMPAIPPLAVTMSAGFDYRSDERRAANGSRATQTGSSIDLENASIFLATPLGKNLSTFLEFPMFETKAAGGAHLSGPGEADNTGVGSRRDIQFETESPAFEIAKLLWNNLLPDDMLPRDGLNFELGVDHLPLMSQAPAGLRLSISPYLIYERRALDLISPTRVPELLGDATDSLMRLDEPQIVAQLQGILVPFGTLTDLAKPETVNIQYVLGITNGSNIHADPNTQKDFVGRVAVQWWHQMLGVFGYYSPDTYWDAIRSAGSIPVLGVPPGVFAGRQAANSFSSVGPDLTIDLRPWEIPVWIENQLLFNEESNPTGFGKRFDWWGGFSQLYVQVPGFTRLVAYGRYDWIEGDHFSDLALGGATGPVSPQEWDAVVGFRWYVLENLNIGPEYAYREFTNDRSAPAHQKLRENFFTIRASLGF